MFQHLSRAWLPAVLAVVATTGMSEAAVVKTNCGTPVQSVTLAQNESSETFSLFFERVAAVHVTVPSGTTRCVKVRFTAAASCVGPFGAECYVRALADKVEMKPDLRGNQILATPDDSSQRPTSFHWVSRLSAGTHTVEVQIRRSSTGSAARLEYWSMDVETLN